MTMGMGIPAFSEYDSNAVITLPISDILFVIFKSKLPISTDPGS